MTALNSLGASVGTFRPNRFVPIHRWYPYLEGYSEQFARSIVEQIGVEDDVYDPFAGSGTTLLVAASRGHAACYSEVNPFLRMVIRAKTSCADAAVSFGLKRLQRSFERILGAATGVQISAERIGNSLRAALGHTDYFPPENLSRICRLREAIERERLPLPVKELIVFCLACITVESSNMIRAGDLRNRTPKEPRPGDPYLLFSKKYLEIISDLHAHVPLRRPVTLLAESALEELPEAASFSAVVTSPPYANGTNYCRNTKLELWVTGLLSRQFSLHDLRQQLLVAGINSARERPMLADSWVQDLVKRVAASTYDPRIPRMIRGYAYDTSVWLGNVYRGLRPGGSAFVDIGDSQFGNIHVPTDKIVIRLAEQRGFRVKSIKTLRTRRSRNGMSLNQLLLEFDRPRQRTSASPQLASMKTAALSFESRAPYRRQPFAKRNWGDVRHSLCSYRGKLKPAIAHFLVSEFTSVGETVLDPLSGAGTIPLEAHLQNRRAIGNDLNELAYILTRAKVSTGSCQGVSHELDSFLEAIERPPRPGTQAVAGIGNFGFNGPLRAYFHEDTLAQILSARDYILANPCTTWSRAIVYASFLHILHGNRPYALSRRSHPVTPFAPTGKFEFRAIRPRLAQKVSDTLAKTGQGAHDGLAIHGDAFDLDFKGAHAVITSPPFLDSTRFFTSNWMRLWAAGWGEKDFINRPKAFIERRQLKEFSSLYDAFLGKCAAWLLPGGRLILHLGAGKTSMSEQLRAIATKHFDIVHGFSEDVARLESFGISDHGRTTHHEFLFLAMR